MIQFYLFLIHQLGPQCHIVPQPYTFSVGFDSVWPSKDYVIRVAEDRSKGALDIYSVWTNAVDIYISQSQRGPLISIHGMPHGPVWGLKAYCGFCGVRPHFPTS